MVEQRVRWAIAGLGKIAHRFANDLTKHVPNGYLYAIASRSEKRTESFANQYEVENTYSSYQELANDPDVDVVYIATIHPFHYDMAKLFLNAGKHVLVEKPAFTELSHWDEMHQLASEKGVLLLEAMKSVTFPAYQSLRQFIKQNKIKITSIEAAFGNWHSFGIEQQIFNPELCGGATLDVGVYPLWLYADLSHLTGSNISLPKVTYWQDNPNSEVDETAEFIFEQGINGNIKASITQNLARHAIIQGPEIKIIIHDKWWNPIKIDVIYKGEHTVISQSPMGGGFEYEATHVSELIIQGNVSSPILRAETSRKVIAIMEQSLKEQGFSRLLKKNN
ncbi:Gfo/Idh/MocA family oxidoreductase [Vibrio pectenicida]|uniref:Gfo/Idh/MocA family oxidoreductase n=1 Tax=Vibrio pectenicida TaxID=62763 RepID=A0A7Y3ZZZ3_9VIBR|nr:Gfo/Idh/MocA family oxidoreductase [Vibrio pectenicida]NOH72212.1 Gfo/Idh/MocA family oxidoreductase [Vibrio pectenicida]